MYYVTCHKVFCLEVKLNNFIYWQACLQNTILIDDYFGIATQDTATCSLGNNGDCVLKYTGTGAIRFVQTCFYCIDPFPATECHIRFIGMKKGGEGGGGKIRAQSATVL